MVIAIAIQKIIDNEIDEEKIDTSNGRLRVASGSAGLDDYRLVLHLATMMLFDANHLALELKFNLCKNHIMDLD